MNWFISSDIHSFYDEWMKALKEAGFDRENKDHGIIVLGDLLDRGDQPLECLEFVNSLHRENRAILIRGNHEDLFEQVYERGYFESYDYHNGTLDTYIKLANFNETKDTPIHRYQKIIIEDGFNNNLIKEYLSNLVDYAELGDNIFVHGWIPVSYTEDTSLPEYLRLWCPVMICDKNWREGDWSEARWLNGMQAWHNDCYEQGKIIWCGHWHASYGNSRYHNDGVEFLSPTETLYYDNDTKQLEPHENHHTFKDTGIMCLDACTVHSKFVNVEVLDI